jgi:hypothetical protein
MNLHVVNCKPEFPEVKKVKCFPNHLNAWVSPEGNAYFFEGAKHLRVATYICIVILDIDPATLKKGTYFNECWDGRLLNLGWLSIANLSWLSEKEESPRFRHKNDLTQGQHCRNDFLALYVYLSVSGKFSRV